MFNRDDQSTYITLLICINSQYFVPNNPEGDCTIWPWDGDDMICYFQIEEKVKCRLMTSTPVPYKIAHREMRELQKRLKNGE